MGIGNWAKFSCIVYPGPTQMDSYYTQKKSISVVGRGILL